MLSGGRCPLSLNSFSIITHTQLQPKNIKWEILQTGKSHILVGHPQSSRMESSWTFPHRGGQEGTSCRATMAHSCLSDHTACHSTTVPCSANLYRPNSGPKAQDRCCWGSWYNRGLAKCPCKYHPVVTRERCLQYFERDHIHFIHINLLITLF